MRTTMTDPGADNLVYEIREIVAIAQKMQTLGQTIIWENIGDPVAKGEHMPAWMKEHVLNAVHEDDTYAYSPTMGLSQTRTYITNERNKEGGIQITADDILFFNGLGDAISKVYRSLHPQTRVIGPNPAYTTHSSAEAAHAGSPHITYALDPHNNWAPNLKEMERKIKDNPQISGILIVNPDNPTGFVYSQKIMQKIVALARKYKLFIISDEIYSNLVYDGVEYKKLAAYIGEVPAIAMRGVSKEFPWPGGRCGWLEFYNRGKDSDFDRYCKSLIDAKMLEVCSTTLPQKLIPRVMQDPQYFPYLQERNRKYQARARIACQTLAHIPELIIHEPQGAFYVTVVFKEGSLNGQQTLDIADVQIRQLVESLIADDIPFDKRFTYYLMGATGMCVVPLQSGFNSTYNGFRFTVLDSDETVFTQHMQQLRDAIRVYLASA